MGQLGVDEPIFDQLEAAAGGPRHNPSLNIKLILSHPPMLAPQSQGLAILSKLANVIASKAYIKRHASPHC